LQFQDLFVTTIVVPALHWSHVHAWRFAAAFQ
jgi:hypothetical protein